MGAQRAKELRAELTRLRHKGKPTALLACLDELEKLEPRDGSWPHRAAEIHRRQGDSGKEIDALLRAAARFRDAGFLLKAIAVCKRVLEIDVAHRVAHEVLDQLSVQRSVPPLSRNAAEGSAPRGTPPTAANEQDPSTVTLEEIILTEVIASGPPTGLVSDPDDVGGLAEIDLSSRSDAAGAQPSEDADAKPDAASELLPHTPLFASLEPEDLGELIRGAAVIHLREGEEAFHQGEPGEALFVIVEGAVALICEEPRKRMLAALAEGQFFGESALLRSEQRNATARAIVDSTLLRVDERLIRQLIARSPQVLVVLLDFLRDRMTQRLIRTSPIFESLSRTEQIKLGKEFRFLEASPGKRLIAQGNPSPALFFVLSGYLEVIRAEGESSSCVVATLEPGDIFGEMSLITGEPAVASVRTRSKCWILYMQADRVAQLLDDSRIRSRIQALIRERRRANLDASETAERRVSLD